MDKKEFYRHYLPHFQQSGQAYFVTWCLKDAVPPKALHTYTLKLQILKSRILALGWANGSGDGSGVGLGEFYSPHDNLSAVANRGTWTRDLISGSGSVEFYSHRDNLRTVANRGTRTRNPGEMNHPSELANLKREYYLVRKKYLKAFDDLLDKQRNPIINLSKPANTAILFEALKFWEGKRIINYGFTIMPNHVHWVFEVKEKDENQKAVFLQDLLQSVKRFSANRINKLEKRQGPLWQKESFDTTIRNDTHLYNAIKYTLKNPVAAGLTSDWTLWPGTWYRRGDWF